MNAPLVWILLPFLVALGLFALRKKRLINVIIGTVFCLFLAALALVTPIGQVTKPGPIQFSLPGEFSILGRVLMLTQLDMPIIAFIFTIGALWFFLSNENRRTSLFIPIGLGIIALLVAALAIKPFILPVSCFSPISAIQPEMVLCGFWFFKHWGCLFFFLLAGSWPVVRSLQLMRPN
jgi:hypothetical protein